MDSVLKCVTHSSLRDIRALVRSNVGIHLKKVHKKTELLPHDIIKVAEYEY
jgi:hypothetical protein